MPNDIEHQLLEFDDDLARVSSRLPPGVGVQVGIVCGIDDHPRVAALEVAPEDSTHPASMIGAYNDDDRVYAILHAPLRKDRPFALASIHRSRNCLDIVNAEICKLSDSYRFQIAIGEAAASQFASCSVRRYGEHGDASGDSAMDQIGGVQDAGSIGIDRHDNDVHRSDRRFRNDECASRNPKNE